MNSSAPIFPGGPGDFPSWEFVYLDVEYDPEARAVWMNYKESAPHHFPLQMFKEIVEVRESLRRLCASDNGKRWPIRYFAIGSQRPNVFSLGGDIAAFTAAVRKRQHATLRAHANICVDIMHGLENAFSYQS
jgi:DSF synthase